MKMIHFLMTHILPKCEVERNAPLSIGEIIIGIFGFASIFLGIALAGALLGGCVNGNTGSSTIVGEQMILPEITDASDNIAVRVFEDIKGARVWVAKDSKVTISYANATTNEYFGIVETRGSMALDVTIEPLTNAATNAPASN